MGVEARVAIAEDLVLDFSGLFTGEPPEKQAPESPVEPLLGAGEYETITEPQKPAERLTEGLEGQQAKKLFLDTQREREDHKRSLEVYKTYQENIKTSSQLQTDILKGLKAGEDVYSLFLKAAKAIALMTSNSLFYSQAEADLIAIYGRGLQEKPPLQRELQEAQKRLQRLLEAEQREQPPDNRERIQRAIEAHRATIERLEDMIAKADTKKSGEPHKGKPQQL